MKKKLLKLIILFVALSFFGCSEKATDMRIFDEDTFELHNYEIPSILGDPQYSDDEIMAFEGTGDIATLADLLAYYDLTDCEFRNSDAIVKNVCFVLKGDYDESGILSVKYEDKDYSMLYFRKDNKLIPFDVYAEYKNGRKWMEGYQGEKILFDSYDEMTEAIRENYMVYDKQIDDVNCEIKNLVVKNFLVDSDNIRCKQEIATQAMDGYIRHYVPEYSDEEIQEMVNANLTLEEASDLLHTVTDAVNYIRARGMEASDFIPNINRRYNGVEWAWGQSAQYTFDHKEYACTGITNLFNRLMAGDFDSEGHVIVAGHTYNYFEDDGLYYYCDFSEIDDPSTAAVSPYYPKYITDDVQDAVSMAKRGSFNFKFICQYEHTGNGVPTGFYANDPNRDLYRLVVSDEIEGKFLQLYHPEDRQICYEKAPDNS